MNDKLKLETRAFASRIAELGFSTLLPAGWVAHDLPAEEVDFSDPTRFFPLAIVTAPHAAIVYAFVARPAYDEGTLHDWAWYLLNHNQIKPRAIGAHRVGNLRAMVGEAVQDSDVGPMVLRFAFVEDGKRLLNLTLMAPELLADTMNNAWFAMLDSFRLETPKGQTAACAPLAEAEAEAVPPSPDPGYSESTRNPAEVSETSNKLRLPEPAAPKEKNFCSFAIDGDTTSLDPETSINANLRDRGIGLVPHVTAADSDDCRATVAAGAIMAEFDVPYGWHVIDDGKRTLVFEPTGKVQINLNLIPREGRNHAAILEAIEAETRASYPAPEFARVTEGTLLKGEIHALGVRNIKDGEQPIEQYHLLISGRDEHMVLRARVTATPDQSVDACNLAELILMSFRFPACSEPESEPAPEPPKPETRDGQPEWWHRAVELEQANKLKAAEEVIYKNVPHIGSAASVAEMYRCRMLRLKAAGDEAGAREAFTKAEEWIFFYASQATSGGEGAALSLQRDEFYDELYKAYGCVNGGGGR